jgi:hypothetical protein
MNGLTLTAQSARNYGRITWAVVVLSGLLVGTLDIIAALTSFYIKSGKSPVAPVSKYIASGVLGKPALKGGAEMIALGLLFHYVIAFLWTIIFFWLYKRWGLLSRNWVLTGFLYGIFIYLMMSQVVVPLSNTPPVPKGAFINKIISALILITMIGLPLSYIAKQVTKRPAGE